MKLKSKLFGAACAAALSLTLSLSAHAAGIAAKHVLLISVDGLHETDMANFIKANPDSTMARLAAHGTHDTSASSAKPSDSFPGLLVSMPSMSATEVKDAVTNMQVAPSIIKALGLDPMALQSVKAEGTKVLLGF